MNNVSDEGGGKVRQSRPLCRVRVCASLLTCDRPTVVIEGCYYACLTTNFPRSSNVVIVYLSCII